jgi:uncharacterized protein YqiB (DUF1249 family)
MNLSGIFTTRKEKIARLFPAEDLPGFSSSDSVSLAQIKLRIVEASV